MEVDEEHVRLMSLISDVRRQRRNVVAHPAVRARRLQNTLDMLKSIQEEAGDEPNDPNAEER